MDAEIITGLVPTDPRPSLANTPFTPTEPQSFMLPETPNTDIAPKLGVVGKQRGLTRHFYSRISELRITIEAHGPRTDNRGNPIASEHRFIQFSSHHLYTDDPEKILAVEGFRGYGVEVWDYDAASRAARAAQIEAAKKNVLDDQEALSALMVDPRMKDFIDAEVKKKLKEQEKGSK